MSSLTSINGTKITVEKFKARSSRDVPSWKMNLYVKGFPQTWNKEKVENFINEKFKTLAEVSSSCVKENEKLGRCFAFVAYKNADDANKAIKEFNEFAIEGEETLYVGYAQKKDFRSKQLSEGFAKQTNETNLFIKSLKEDVTEEQLKAVFSKYGEVTSVALKVSDKIPKSIETHGVKVKFGFVNFKDDNVAKTAFMESKKSPEVKALISEYHSDKKDFIYFAQPKNVREQYLKMIKKNIQTSSMYQAQQNFFKMMSQMMNKKMQPPRQARGAKGQSQAAPGVPQMNFFNPMMSMFGGAGMDPNMAAAGGNPFAMNPAMMFANMGAMGAMGAGAAVPQFGFGQPPVVQLPQTTAIPKPAVPEPTETKDLAWLINNQSKFEMMDSNEKRKLLGNLMYYRVATQNVDKDLVPKITGMLIDLDVLELTDIIDILTKEDSLKEKIADAISVINDTE